LGRIADQWVKKLGHDAHRLKFLYKTAAEDMRIFEIGTMIFKSLFIT
jgi:hypothetical protein